jgi:hypothetical protein
MQVWPRLSRDVPNATFFRGEPVEYLELHSLRTSQRYPLPVSH